jgi:hypothetical protein
MKKIIKRAALTALLSMSILAVMPVGASAEWKQDQSKNYYWLENGNKAIGWKFINGNWYNFRHDGAMQVSWVQDNGNWYYLWSNGTMASDAWLNKAGGWYYFDSTGKMIYDSTVVGKRQYDFTKPAFIISKDLDKQNSTSTEVAEENKVVVSTSTTQGAVTVEIAKATDNK